MKTGGAKTKMTNPDLQTLKDMVEGIQIAMFTTVNSDGSLHSRPMLVHELEGDGDLWFFTRENSGTIKEISNDQMVNLSFSNADQHRFVSVCGTAQVITDKEKAKEHWSPVYKTWFPEGLDDPSLAMVHVKIESARCWDSSSGTMVKLVGLAKNVAHSLLSGKAFKSGEMQAGESKDINLHH